MDSIISRILHWFGNHEASQTGIDRLKEERRKFELRSKTLQVQLHDCVEALKAQRTELQGLREMYGDSQAEIEKLKKEKNKLRKIILDQTGSERVSDDEIKKTFTNIRQKIQAIAHSKALDMDVSVSVRSPRHPEVHNLWYIWNDLSLADRGFVLRGQIFSCIVDRILEQKLFGIIPTHHHVLQEIEYSLGELEEYMSFSQVPAEAIVDWRHATMKAIDQTKIEHDYIGGVESAIMSFLSCLIREQAKNSAPFDKLQRDIHDVCKDAYQLGFLMRKSKDHYTCEMFSQENNVRENETALEVHGVLHGGRESSSVALTICGALIKRPWNDDMEPVVLEPAHVLVESV
ncbi:uncharacterized protein MAM_08345 [Metarhizium album ARSEF 1941]|uniref:Uncharacterized protein n=1 Tax=Metarhizium album (strain ARSEF 1941) TaxID=1081103 RepID=A0A0B2WD91_METAS|nr:uncharacterized protein MAM_08345 [Metarhizium album ARSEF 1941]KHN93781.1 hypothetical protein MAM_08345 [Metarhizium album ARSEF 1941]